MAIDTRGLNIFVDCTMVKRGQAGIRTYAISLVRALAGLSSTCVTCAVARDNEDDWGDAVVVRSNFTGQRPEQRALWRAGHIPGLAKETAADGVLIPAPEPLSGLACPVATVVHDLGPLMAPSLYGRVRYLRYLLTLRRTVESSSLVITPSRTTKLDLIRWVGPDSTRIVVAGPRLSGEFTGLSRTGDGDFALYVGAMLPHKNVGPVIRAFDEETFIEGMPSRLVLVGPDYGGEVGREMRDAGPRVQHLGFVPMADLDSLYDSASVVVFPTLFEGFGIPLLEALSAGSRVIASDLPVLREVGGDRVTYVPDAVRPQAWARALAACQGGGAVGYGAVDWSDAAEAVRTGFENLLADGH